MNDDAAPGQTVNPYAPPASLISPARGGLGGPLKWVFLALEVVRFGLSLADDTPPGRGQLGDITIASICVALVASIVGLVWLYKACSALPQQILDLHRLSPGAAVGFLFIPCFNLVWAFMVHLRLCGAIDTALERSGAPRRGLQSLAMITVVAHFATGFSGVFGEPLLVLAAGLASAGLWFFYMFAADGALARIEDARIQEEHSYA